MRAWKVTVEVRPWPEGGFVADVPALQGCWVVAPTLEQAIMDIQDGIGMSIASRVKHGEDLPGGIHQLVGDDMGAIQVELAVVLP